MSKKVILLALTAVSMAAFALSATAMAVEEDVPLHLVPKPEGVKTIDGLGSVSWTGTFGTFTCISWHGNATFSSSTTGMIELTFEGCSSGGPVCTTSEGQPSGTITTTELEFHLLTVEDSVTHATGSGILITPNSVTKVFADLSCPLIGKGTWGGNGLIGTITKPECGKTSNEAAISFSSSSQAVQTHKTVVGTSIEYSTTLNGQSTSLDASGAITLATEAKLECT